MAKPKKITVGMFRPLYDELLKEFPLREHASVLKCSCGVHILLPTDLREHWQLGHFDTPVYQDVAPAFPERLLDQAAVLKEVFDRGVCYEDRGEATDQFLYDLVAWMTSERKKRKSATPTEDDLSGKTREREEAEE